MKDKFNNVYIYNTNIDEYNNNSYFNPSEKYLEGLNIRIKSDEKIYEKVRQLFITMKLDEKNINTEKWNPFGEFIHLNDNVVIKPNLVYHINELKNGSMDSLITNFSIIRPIIDYTIIALKKTGKIIVGDAPVQECKFLEVVKIGGLDKAINIYNRKGYDIELIDFRKNNNNDLECIEVDLKNDSSLKEVEEYYKQFAISNYDLRIMHNHHSIGKHQYLIPKKILEADVIINLPKAKTHRIAGMTACMKNFVGANAKKEYLPHHRNGSIYRHGDEFPEKSLIKNLQSFVKNYTYLHNPIVNFTNKGLRGFQKLLRKNRYLKGCWYGNDTIWRTILDINKIIIYSDKKGNMQEQRQRKVFNLVDMIVSGEGEGPLKPDSKKVGLLVSGFNQLNVDMIVCKIMGFDFKKIKYLINGFKLKKYKISSNNKFNCFDKDGLVNDMAIYNKHFRPSNGWIDYLNENKNNK